MSIHENVKQHCRLVEKKACKREFKILKQKKQPARGVLKKRCPENMQQIYKKTPMPKRDFNKVALQLYWNRTLVWTFHCKFAAYFQDTFL